jgi:hypothetical protein
MLKEFLYYLKRHKRWIFLPLILAVVLFASLALVSQMAPIVSPFIYTLF